ncbi:uncharacterized protein LOC142661430 [Rhinoderma darwinii]|uniref:uncharacterized protein LOC142661430 n=1 Tax=Rhinoderma darwinii TaxID=43563 RepID=UPI003F6749C3
MVQDIKTRWWSCCNQFRREIGEKGRSGDGGSRKRPYIYMKQLMFLKDIMEMRTTTDNLEDTADDTIAESQPQPPAAHDLPLSPEPTPLHPAPVQSARAVASAPEERPLRTTTRRRRAPQPSAGGQVDSRVLEYLSRAADEDGQDFFARGIVPLLRLVPMDRMARLHASIITLIDASTPPHNPNHCFTAIEQWHRFATPPTTPHLPAPYHPPTPIARPHPYMRPMPPPFPAPTYHGQHQHH